MSRAERQTKLENWREQMVAGLNGERPAHPAMRVFCDAVLECNMPVDEGHCFLDAMLMDLDRDRYETFEELRSYMRGSASAIGVLMCYAMGAKTDPDTIERARALGEAMQLTNFLRDVGEDYERGRIYLPAEDFRQFGVTELDIAQHRNDERFKRLMRFEISRARRIYAFADPGIKQLPRPVRKAVLLARLLYSYILNRIEAQDYDVFSRRARTSLPQKAVCATKVALTSERIFDQLIQRGTLT
jgi:phytoene synthase